MLDKGKPGVGVFIVVVVVVDTELVVGKVVVDVVIVVVVGLVVVVVDVVVVVLVVTDVSLPPTRELPLIPGVASTSGKRCTITNGGAFGRATTT